MMGVSPSENQMKRVASFQELVATPFQAETNALCWDRTLQGDFAEIITQLGTSENITAIEPTQLLALELSPQGQLARAVLLQDLKLLADHGAAPVLNVIEYYDRDSAYPFFSTDVYSFHVDRSPVPTATFLCTYHGASSDILPNAQGTQKVLIPEIREELKRLYGGKEEGFEAFLTEHFFDLHYAAHATAVPINLGVGSLWKLAVDHPESPVLPCLHRAPKENPGEKKVDAYLLIDLYQLARLN